MQFTEQEKEQLLDEYKDLVKSKARLYFMLGADKEDVVQEGMIGLFKAIESYSEDRGCSFRTYVDICVNRQIISAIKTASRNKHQVLNGAISLETPVSDDENITLGETLAAGSDADPETIAVVNELSELILSENNRLLSTFERQVARGLMEGKDYREIARKLGKSPKSIDNTIQRVRNKLRQFFTED